MVERKCRSLFFLQDRLHTMAFVTWSWRCGRGECKGREGQDWNKNGQKCNVYRTRGLVSITILFSFSCGIHLHSPARVHLQDTIASNFARARVWVGGGWMMQQSVVYFRCRWLTYGTVGPSWKVHSYRFVSVPTTVCIWGRTRFVRKKKRALNERTRKQ